jgi:ATP-binding cassette, subfamily B, bacterial
VLNDGMVVEEGDHDALMACGGRYARMFALQARGFADQVPGAAMNAAFGGTGDG